MPYIAFSYLPHAPSRFERNYERVQNAMTADEVRSLLGTETRETHERECQINDDGQVKNAVRGDRVMVWEIDGQVVLVGFNDERVVSKYFFAYDL